MRTLARMLATGTAVIVPERDALLLPECNGIDGQQAISAIAEDVKKFPDFVEYKTPTEREPWRRGRPLR